jgi:transcriptional antiterminator NusG
MRWYILKTQSNRENKVSELLRSQVEDDGISSLLEEVLVPEEKIIENTMSGQKRTRTRRFYPGYVFLKADLTEDFFLAVRKISFASGFIGGNKPTPMPANEVEKIISLNEQLNSQESPTYKITYATDEELRIISGPFNGFTCTVNKVDYDKSSLEVAVQVFGRDTEISLGFADVAK